MKKKLLAMVLLCSISGMTLGAELEVCSTCTYTTISDALVAASDGDTITLLDPVHTESNIQPSNAYITLQGQGMDQTILQAAPSADPSNGTLLNINPYWTVRDMTLRHAGGLGAIHSYGAFGVVLERLRITQNYGTRAAVGLTSFSGGQMSNCVVEYNQTDGITFSWSTGSMRDTIVRYNHTGIALDDVTLSISGSTITQNSNSGIRGVYASLDMKQSTVSYNQGSQGGGIYISSGFGSLMNTTIAGNNANEGGGIYFAGNNYSGLALLNCTVAFNNGGQGAGIYSVDSLIRAGNTIISNNYNGDCAISNGDPNFVEVVGPNISGDNTCQNFSMSGVNPLIWGLGNYGDPTQTVNLGWGSPAIDAGATDICALSVDGKDQRGFPRFVGNGCDIGALERVTTPLPPITSPDYYSVTTGQQLADWWPGVLGNDVDPNNTSLKAILLTHPQSGNLNFRNNGTFTYMPANGFVGTVTFTYRAWDGGLGTDETVTIEVLPN